MDLGDTITVTKLNIQDQRGYLMIGWQPDSFEMYLYLNENLWKGKFSSNRLAGFSRNLQMTEREYYNSVKHCLSEQQNDYSYEIRGGFFYWKRKLNNTVMIEGFLPVDLETKARNTPDLIEVLISLNSHLQQKNNLIKNKFRSLKSEYQRCIKDTEEFLNLKIDMEKALCDKFLNLLNIQKTNVESYSDEKKGDNNSE